MTTLSQIHCVEITVIEEVAPEIDLNTDYFDDIDYHRLKSKNRANEPKYPDIQILDKLVYIRTEQYTGDPAQESSAWKLWIPERLLPSVIGHAFCSLYNC